MEPMYTKWVKVGTKPKEGECKTCKATPERFCR